MVLWAKIVHPSTSTPYGAIYFSGANMKTWEKNQLYVP